MRDTKAVDHSNNGGAKAPSIEDAIQVVDDALENHWLNLREGPYPEDADEFEEAWNMVKVVAKERSDDW